MARQHAKQQQQSKPAQQKPETPSRNAPVPQRNESVPQRTSPAPSHEQIAQRAYELYLSRGGEHGHHEQDWTQAERELGLGR